MKKAVLALIFLSMLFMLTLTAIPVHASIVGDVNGDGQVDVVDFGLVCRAFGTDNSGLFGGTLGDWGVWNPDCDMYMHTPLYDGYDGKITLSDEVTVYHYLGTGVTSLSPQVSSQWPMLSLVSTRSKDTYRNLMIQKVDGLNMFQFIVEWDSAKLEKFNVTTLGSTTDIGLGTVGTAHIQYAQIAPNKMFVACALTDPTSLTVGGKPVTLAQINFSHVPGANGPTIITVTSNLYNAGNPYAVLANAIPHTEAGSSKVT